MKEVKRKKRRKLSFQKIFNLISAVFILSCIIFYGTRFIKLYRENNKVEEIETLAKSIKNDNTENDKLKNINGDFYFNGKDNNNYLKYSNIIWRIIRINKDNSITLVLDNSITSLAKGKNEYLKSNIHYWLNNKNEDYTGILENNLNSPSKYLTYTKTCNNKVTDTKNISCTTTTEDIYITVPSITDYINTGTSDSFMNNEENFYLINEEEENKSWYVTDDGRISTASKDDILGIKPVITIKSTTKKIDGNGTIESPYTIEEEASLFASYVKLDNDLWRVYEVTDDDIKLSLDGYLTLDNEEVKYKYSTNNYYHNDTVNGCLAYYLKNNYLPKLSYKDIINEVKYSNGIYNNTDNYDYKKTLNTKVDTKVAILSIGDPILNPTNTNYYLSSGVSKDSNLIYVMQNDFRLYTKVSTTSLNIVPTISIKKDILKNGNGTKESPWEV